MGIFYSVPSNKDFVESELELNFDEMRKLVQEMTKIRKNVLIIGKQGSGKRSFINSCYFAVNDKRDNFVCESSKSIGTRTTTKYRMVKVCNELCLFYTPGINYMTPAELQLLDIILSGIKEDQDLPYGDNENEIKNKLYGIKKDKSNKIDFVLWIASAMELEGAVTNYALWRWLDVVDTKNYQNLFEYIKKSTFIDLLPFLIYTHKDKTNLTPKQLKNEAFYFLPSEQKFLLKNYTTENEMNNVTEFTVLTILQMISQKKNIL